MNFDNTTERLRLRVLNDQDAHMVLDFYQRNVNVFETFEPMIGEDFYTLEHQKNVLSYEYQQILKFAMVRFWLFEKENPYQIIGTICFHNISRPVFSSCTTGYKMDRSYINRGYCTEALHFGMELMMQELDIHRFEAFVMPENTPSIRLLERLGYHCEGLMRDKVLLNGRWRDHYLYAYINHGDSA